LLAPALSPAPSPDQGELAKPGIAVTPSTVSAKPLIGLASLFNRHDVHVLWLAVEHQPVRLSTSESRPPRRSNDGQAILKAI
jgi:hypothetical protein